MYVVDARTLSDKYLIIKVAMRRRFGLMVTGLAYSLPTTVHDSYRDCDIELNSMMAVRRSNRHGRYCGDRNLQAQQLAL